jgi:FkbM family methyltransferase
MARSTTLKRYSWKYISGVQRYGLSRALAGMAVYLRYRFLKPKQGCISTSRDGLCIHFEYPAQFMPTLVVFKELVEPEHEFLRHVLTSDSVFFDVGGGIGCYTMVSAMVVGGPIHTFEPVDENLTAIQKNLEANGITDKVILNHVALSDQEGFCHIRKAGNLLGSRVADVSSGSGHGDTPVTTLDVYCLQRNIRHIDVLKIDVEGHERRVLEGARLLLAEKCIDIIILERNSGQEQFYQSLEETGFECLYYDPQENLLIPIIPLCRQTLNDLTPSPFHGNLIFIRHGAMDRLPSELRPAPRPYLA